jgi:hypothetical protein
MKYLKYLIIGMAMGFLSHFIVKAMAADHGQWDRSNPIVKWYQELMQPDNPAVGCCGEADAYWADSFEVSDKGEYIAIITDERPDEPLKRHHVPVGTRVLVPNHKIKFSQYDPQQPPSNPTGHGVIFLSSSGEFVYCYITPGGA